MQFENLSKVADRRYCHKVTDTRLKKDIRERLGKWISQTSASVVQTPVDKIEWGKLIESAIWRRPPFIDEKDREKGFRDALILETVRFFCEKESVADIAFVSMDRLLREASTEQLAHFPKFTSFESTDEFASYLKLTKEKLTAEFVREIKKKAHAKFFAKSDNSCLYYRESVADKIKKEFEDKFKLPLAELNLSLLYAGIPRPSWKSISNEKRWITPPQFERIEGTDIFHWNSTVTFVELFKYQPSVTISSGLLSPAISTKKLRILKFVVLWSAKVKSDGRFYGIVLSKIDFVSESFNEPTKDDIENFDVKEKETE